MSAAPAAARLLLPRGRSRRTRGGGCAGAVSAAPRPGVPSGPGAWLRSVGPRKTEHLVGVGGCRLFSAPGTPGELSEALRLCRREFTGLSLHGVCNGRFPGCGGAAGGRVTVTPFWKLCGCSRRSPCPGSHSSAAVGNSGQRGSALRRRDALPRTVGCCCPSGASPVRAAGQPGGGS